MTEAVQESYEIDLTDSKTLLISDFEGTTPTAHFAKFKEYCTDVNPNTNKLDISKRVIFLGDVFDNTAQNGDNCKGDVCEDPDIDEDSCIDNSNYVALETIKLLVDNPRSCKFVIGNRDINKIKLIPFFSFQTGDKWWKKGESYAEIVKNLIIALPPESDPWLIKKDQLKYFRPFWSSKPTEYNTGWLDDKEIKFIDIYHRFERIFGKDPSKGTMSALVTLKCIPDELFPGKEKMEDFYRAVDEQYTKDKSLYDVEWRKKVRAALTITVFMRMLDKDLWIKDKTNKGDINKTEFKALDGYLYYYLTQAPAAYYAEYQNNLFLFAHGGITNDFVKNIGTGEIDKIQNKQEWITQLDKRKEEIKGGAINPDNQIIKSINYYNKAFLELVEKFFNSNFKNAEGEWIETMLTLLDLSGGKKKNPNQVKQPYMEILDDYKGDYNKIYNVFGHASISVGYTFGQTRDDKDNKIKGNNTYFLSTDYSSTLFKKGIVCDSTTTGQDSDYNKNYLLAILDTTGTELKLNFEGTLILGKESYEFTPYTEQKTIKDFDKDIQENIKKNGKQKLFFPTNPGEKITLIFDETKNLLTEIDEIDKNNTSEYCTFNGIAKINDKAYNIYSSVYGKKEPYSIVSLPAVGGTQASPLEATVAKTASVEAATSAPSTSAPSTLAPAPVPSTSAPATLTSAPATSTPAPATPAPAKPATPAPATPAKKTTGAKKSKTGLRDPAFINDPILLVKDKKTGDYEQQEAGKHNLLKKGRTKTTFLKKVGAKTRKTTFLKKVGAKTRKTTFLKKVGPKTRKTTFLKKVGPKTRKLKGRKVGPKTRKLNGRKLKRRKVMSKKRKTLKKN